MSTKTDRPYTWGGSIDTEQAARSSANPGATSVEMRILIELQVLSMMIHDAYNVSEDLQTLRQNVADSIT